MDKHTRSLLTSAEAALIDSASPEAIADLDHNSLVKLARLLRKGADKYRQNYRRQEHATVVKDRSRAKTPVANRASAEKAAAFGEALSRVSGRIAALDRQDAASLREERLAAARAAKSGGPSKVTSAGRGKTGRGRADVTNRGPSGKAGATRSANAKAQAKRDGK